ncbi:MAG: hypothetical protein ABSH01_23615 [Terriglobia bacterium]|jgi:hypothetical protein
MPLEVPVEIKKKSSAFEYQQRKYAPEELSRAVILCTRHDPFFLQKWPGFTAESPTISQTHD